MKKVHDMGGRREEFGPVDRKEHEVEDWERLADAVNYVLNAKGHKTTDEMRRAIEGLEDYREMSYYERWAAAAEMLVVEKGTPYAGGDRRTGRGTREALGREMIAGRRRGAVRARGRRAGVGHGGRRSRSHP
jgi:hypothetical protein